MDELLQIDTEGVAIGAHDDIGTDAAVDRHVAARIGEADIAWIVGDGPADLFFRRYNELPRPGFRLGKRRIGRFQWRGIGVENLLGCNPPAVAGNHGTCRRQPGCGKG